MTYDIKQNEQVWKTLYAAGKNDLRYPNDVLVRVGYRYLNPDLHKKVLDFGFGTGANLLHFTRLGFQMSGIEISEHAIEVARDRLNEGGTLADLKLYRPGTPLPYEADFFDAIIAWQVLYYNDWESLAFAVSELERVLRPGGLFIAATAAPGDISQKIAEPIGDALFCSQVPGQEGCVLVIPEQQDLSRFFLGRKLEVGEFGYRIGETVARHWIVVFEKE